MSRCPLERLRKHGGLASLAVFFGAKILVGLALLKLSAEMLPVAGFALFSQFVMLWALLNLVASGGVQNGLIRQIAGAGDAPAARASFRAGGRIWAAASLVLLALLPFSAGVSVLLVGHPGAGWIVPWLVGGAMLAGAGQLFSAVLIGSQRLAANVASQGAGLVGGFVAAAACLYRGEAGWAVVAFAWGAQLTPLTAWWLARGSLAVSPGPSSGVGREVRALLGYSGAFLAVATMTPAVLFVLRYFYLETFGVTALAEWLVANRVSDVSTQLIGLFMVQWFLPTLARPGRSIRDDRRTTLAAFLLGTGAMGLVLAAFLIAAPVLVPLLLSDDYLPATGAIGMYMAGDVLRVAASIAMFSALARRRLGLYVGLETAAALLIALIVGLGVRQGWMEAPFVGYLTAYGVLAVILCGRFVATRRAGRPAAGGTR